MANLLANDNRFNIQNPDLANAIVRPNQGKQQYDLYFKLSEMGMDGSFRIRLDSDYHISEVTLTGLNLKNEFPFRYPSVYRPSPQVTGLTDRYYSLNQLISVLNATDAMTAARAPGSTKINYNFTLDTTFPHCPF